MQDRKFAIVVTAYNRAKPLENLLRSLDGLRAGQEIPLVISIDNRGTPEVNRIAEQFVWRHGEKKVLIHEQKKGLRAHFIWAGDQTAEYGNVLFVEDDLYLSPYAADYVNAVIDRYQGDRRVAGGALYNPVLCEFDGCKFYQVEDGFDNYFFQHPYWGNVWMKEQWDDFKRWLATYEYNPQILPANVQRWNITSFKKLYVQYLVETDRTMVYPRVSYLTNMGEMGLHSRKRQTQFQTSVQYGQRKLALSTLDESRSVYDAFFELKPELLKALNPALRPYDFTVDMRGLHSFADTEYLLTRRPVKAAVASFSDDMRPIECGMILGFGDGDIKLARKKDVLVNRWFNLERIAKDVIAHNYAMRYRDILMALYLSIRQQHTKR